MPPLPLRMWVEISGFPPLVIWTRSCWSIFSQLNKLYMVVVSCSVVSDSLWPHGLQPVSLLCPWSSPGKNTGVSCHFILPGVFLTQGSNPCLLHWQTDSLPLSHQGSPKLYGLFLKSWKHSEANTVLSSYWSDIPGRLWTQSKWAKPLPSGMLTCPLDDPKGLGQKSESSSAWAWEDCLLEVKINWK